MTSPFQTDDVRADLKGRSLRGGAFIGLAQAGKFVVKTGSLVVLARLLTPEDYGLFGMVFAIVGFLTVFMDIGLSMATIQKKDLEQDQVNALFWINTVASGILAAVFAAMAPLIAWFYEEPRLFAMTLPLAGFFLVGGLGLQHRALLKRKLHMRQLAIAEISSVVAGATVAIVLAAVGARYWALVANQGVMTFTLTLLLWFFSGWRPGKPAGFSRARQMIRFGLDVTVFDVVNYLTRNVDHILVGKFHGSDALGIYSRAYALMMLPVQNIRRPFNSVAMPALSALQTDADAFRRYYGRYITLLGAIMMPTMAVFWVCSEEVILLVLGTQWLEAAPIFQVLALVAFTHTVVSSRGVVLLALGKSARYRNFGIVQAVITVAAFFAGVHWGAIGVAISYVIAFYVILVPSLFYCFHETPISVGFFFRVLARPFLTSILMGVAVYLLRPLLMDLHLVFRLGICSLAGAALYLGLWLVTPGGRVQVRYYYQSMLDMLRKRMSK